MTKKILSLNEAFLKIGPFFHHELLGSNQKIQSLGLARNSLLDEAEVLNHVSGTLQDLIILSETWSTLYCSPFLSDNYIDITEAHSLINNLEKYFIKTSSKLSQKLLIKIDTNADNRLRVSNRSFRALLICLFQSAFFFGGKKGSIEIETILLCDRFSIKLSAKQLCLGDKSPSLLKQIKDFDDEEKQYPTLLLFRKFLTSLVEILQVDFSEKVEGHFYEVELVFPLK